MSKDTLQVNHFQKVHFVDKFIEKFGRFFYISCTLESEIDLGQGINIGPGNFFRKNKRRALNKGRA